MGSDGFALPVSKECDPLLQRLNPLECQENVEPADVAVAHKKDFGHDRDFRGAKLHFFCIFAARKTRGRSSVGRAHAPQA